MAKDPLKFISEIEANAKALYGDSVRRNFDAIITLKAENSRLKREIEELKAENQRLAEQIANRVVNPITVSAPPTQPAAKEPETQEDATAARFSMMELD